MPTLAHAIMGVNTIDPADAEARLIRESLAGDQDAFAALVRRYQGRVFRLAGRFFRRPEEVEEVAQETFLRTWMKLGTYRAQAPFEHWLTRLCLRCAYDRLRRSRTETEALAQDEAEAAATDPNARLEVERLLARLPAADRFLLILLEGEEWSVAEIAERLGWTQVNVKVRAHRARKRLRRILEEG
ncbi:MAG TPA: sigma-70 family RNA polymerase sigma factor [Thermoanaerobaculia bacterium]|jgi:RNA polymerase sigma-70 factor (ECF subfamily)|nr:sigma-70 family RNA polymerase sigma factor [Thermoanaerobaculia bacterium]